MATIEVNWTELKKFISERNIPINWWNIDGNYFIKALDDGMTVSTVISQHNPADPDLIDFQDNFKDTGNKVLSVTHALQANILDVKASESSVILLPSNRDRKGFVLFNNSNSIAYVSYSEPASTTNFTFLMEPRSLYETPGVIFKGQINCIWEGSEGAMKVTEIL